MLAVMPIALRPFAKKKSVIITGIISFLALCWGAVNTLSNVDFIVQKLGFQENVAKFLASPKTSDLAIIIAFASLLVSLLFESKHQTEQTDGEPKLLSEKALTEKQLLTTTNTTIKPQATSKTTPVLKCEDARVVKISIDDCRRVSENENGNGRAVVADFRFNPTLNSYPNLTVRAKIEFHDLGENQKKEQVKDGVWFREKDKYKIFKTGDTFSLVIALLDKQILLYEHDTKRVNIGRSSQSEILYPNIRAIKGRNFHIKVELVGEYYTILVYNETFEYGLSLEPELKFEQIKAGQIFQFSPVENQAKREFKTKSLIEFIKEGEDMNDGEILPITWENAARFSRSQTYNSRVERFLTDYFDDSYVKRFQEKEVVALQEFLKELLD